MDCISQGIVSTLASRERPGEHRNSGIDSWNNGVTGIRDMKGQLAHDSSRRNSMESAVNPGAHHILKLLAVLLKKRQ